MKKFAIVSLGVFAMGTMVWGQAIERPRPLGWDRLVPGGRFMDRFEKERPIGEKTSNCWGGDNVKPRDVRLGMEDREYSYWGGNIVRIGDTYHMFVARWRENAPRGHMSWGNSEIAHCVSSRPDGDFKVKGVLGNGHNPELFFCKDGSLAVYCILGHGNWQAHVYRAKTVEGPWTCERMKLDLNGKKMIEGESNFSFCRRPDGSVLAVCRGGGIWLSEDGIKPFVRKSPGSVYPKVPGKFEDPVLWRDDVQYHMIVNDWLGRVAWYLTSPDGFNWTTLPGEAYTPAVCPGWFKLERIKMLQDEWGRVVQANFAVIDCLKWDDHPNDIHSSKNLTVPMNPGRRVSEIRKAGLNWEVRIAKEPGFDPTKDIDVESVIFGLQSFVAYGAGVHAVGSQAKDGDLVLTFPQVSLSEPVVELLGKERSGRIFFATARIP